MKKKLTVCLCLLILFTAFVGCSKVADQPTPSIGDTSTADTSPSNAVTSGIDRIKAKGTLILATESTYPPFQYLIVENGKTINSGLDIDIARGIAESLGVELVIHEMAFDSIIPSVQAGTADMGGSFTPTAERAEAIDFSQLYYLSNHSIIIRKGEVDQYPNEAAFSGKKLGAQKGTVQEQVIQSMNNVTLLGLPKVTSLVQELITGNIDGIVADFAVADTYVAAYPDKVEKASFQIPDESGGVAMLIAKGQTDLMDAIDKYIKDNAESGEIQKLYEKNLQGAIDQIIEAGE